MQLTGRSVGSISVYISGDSGARRYYPDIFVQELCKPEITEGDLRVYVPGKLMVSGVASPPPVTSI